MVSWNQQERTIIMAPRVQKDLRELNVRSTAAHMTVDFLPKSYPDVLLTLVNHKDFVMMKNHARYFESIFLSNPEHLKNVDPTAIKPFQTLLKLEFTYFNRAENNVYVYHVKCSCKNCK